MESFDKKVFYKQIGQKIKKARTNFGLNQEELGDKVGISRVSIVNIEKGRQMPPVHIIWNMAAALGTSIENLFPEVGPITSQASLEKIVKEYGAQFKPEQIKSIFDQLGK